MSEDSNKTLERSSDAPVDLVRERETFVRSFLKKGVELTEELLHENVELRDETARLRHENARLRAQVASDDAIRNLLSKIEDLEVEKKALLVRSEELAEAQASDEGRYVEIERELNDLANLYVASYQLHASLSVRRVTRHLLDMVGQLVGAFSFAIYVVEGEAGVVRPIASEKVSPDELLTVPLGEGPVGEACLTGIALIPDKLSNGSIGSPMAIVPLLPKRKACQAASMVPPTAARLRRTTAKSIGKPMRRIWVALSEVARTASTYSAACASASTSLATGRGVWIWFKLRNPWSSRSSRTRRNLGIGNRCPAGSSGA